MFLISFHNWGSCGGEGVCVVCWGGPRRLSTASWPSWRVGFGLAWLRKRGLRKTLWLPRKRGDGASFPSPARDGFITIRYSYLIQYLYVRYLLVPRIWLCSSKVWLHFTLPYPLAKPLKVLYHSTCLLSTLDHFRIR